MQIYLKEDDVPNKNISFAASFTLPNENGRKNSFAVTFEVSHQRLEILKKKKKRKRKRVLAL